MDVMEFLNEKRPMIDSVIQKYLPKSLDRAKIEWLFGASDYEYDIDALNKALAEPVWDLLDRGGKRWRPALFLLIAEAFGADLEKVKDFLVIPELAHNGSLMVDDIEDLAETRRGEPCTHKKFGNDVAINAGNFMYFLPSLVLTKNKNNFDSDVLVRAYDVFCDELTKIHTGQATDIYWHKGAANNITEKQYMQMCANKTGCLARMAGRLAVILSGGTPEQERAIGKVCETIGVAFQIQDDILSVTSKEFAEKKGYGDDITEGKRSLVVIHTLNNASEQDKKRLLEILSMHTREGALIDEAIEIMNRYNAVEHAKTVAKNLVSDAWNHAENLIPEGEPKQKLKLFTNFLIERSI